MDVVITILFTKMGDPHRGGQRLPADVSLLQELINSIDGCEIVVLHDELNVENQSHVTFEQIDANINVYFQRWVSYKNWLEAHPEVTRIWCVDGTDVEMLRSPFNEQQDGILYVGSEKRTIDFPWLDSLHPSARPFIEEHGDLRLVNAGLCGGDRGTVLEFLTDLTELIPAALAAGDITDMGVFNQTVWTKYAARCVTGEKVHTVFCDMDYNNKFAWWRHK